MKQIKQNSYLFLIYIFASIIMILVLAKYFIYDAKINSTFLSIDIISLFPLLMLLFISHKFSLNTNKKMKNVKDELLQNKNKWENTKRSLKNKLQEYEEQHMKQDKSYQAKIINNLFENNNLKTTKHNFLHQLANTFNIGAAIIYKETKPSGYFSVEETYALPDKFKPAPFNLGDGLNGQTAQDGEPKVITKIPDDYFSVSSGLGKTKGKYLYLLPVVDKGKCKYLIELITFTKNEIEVLWPKISERLIKENILS